MESSSSLKYFLEIVKAVIIAVLISLVLILASAFVLKLANVPDEYIPIINQVIKGLSILLACLLSLKLKGNGWLRGIVVGLLYIALAYVVFSLLSKDFAIGLANLNDLAIGAISGLISGIIAVNIRK